MEEKSGPVEIPVLLLVAPPVEKFVPLQEEAFWDDQRKVAEEPDEIVIEPAVLLAVRLARAF